jgi:hypothetical protein
MIKLPVVAPPVVVIPPVIETPVVPPPVVTAPVVRPPVVVIPEVETPTDNAPGDTTISYESLGPWASEIVGYPVRVESHTGFPALFLDATDRYTGSVRTSWWTVRVWRPFFKESLSATFNGLVAGYHVEGGQETGAIRIVFNDVNAERVGNDIGNCPPGGRCGPVESVPSGPYGFRAYITGITGFDVLAGDMRGTNLNAHVYESESSRGMSGSLLGPNGNQAGGSIWADEHERGPIFTGVWSAIK